MFKNIFTIVFLKRIFGYLIIGLIASFVDFLLFNYLIKLQIPIYFSNLISIITGITISFALNVNFNYKIKDNYLKRFKYFFITCSCGYLLGTLIIYIFTYLHITLYISKLLSMLLVASFQFLVANFFIFSEAKKIKFSNTSY
jgi:putative flippase GtrA